MNNHTFAKTFIACLCLALTHLGNANTLATAITEGTTSGDIRIRYENVDQDNDSIDTANALTMRTRIGYTTGDVSGFSVTAEFEDVRVIAGIDNYTVGPTGFNLGEYSVIADPEVTELDQGYLQYKSTLFTAKLGRQVMTFDNHRFIGHVGWRQDRQTFDGISLKANPSDALSIQYNHINKRKRIFAGVADLRSNDHLLNLAYKLPLGTITTYGYFLEVDNNTNNSLDTVGIRFSGKKDKLSYAAEYASQSYDNGNNDNDTHYLMGKLTYKLGPVTLESRYEILGSDDGNYGFSTPLATLHKFNGWADQFINTPSTGLEDIALSIRGKAGPGKWAVIFHSFSSNKSLITLSGDGESTYSDNDLGTELDAVFSMKFSKLYNTGIKFAQYSAGDRRFGKVDTRKIWGWIGLKF